MTVDAVTLDHTVGDRQERVEVPNDFVFVFAGGEPPYPLLNRMGVAFTGQDQPEAAPSEAEPVETP